MRETTLDKTDVLIQDINGRVWVLCLTPARAKKWADIGAASLSVGELRCLWMAQRGEQIPADMLDALWQTKRIMGGSVDR